MRILLIDADSRIPNLPIMKISNWYKDRGVGVDFISLNLPYYPYKNKKRYSVPNGYDFVYCSVIFSGNKDYIISNDNNIIFGGSGVDLQIKLPIEIENCLPDYSLYPNNDISYGFITRGCIRTCKFCDVWKKEGYIHKVNNVGDIVRHKKVKFLDNNFLGYYEHKKILQELLRKQIKFQFNQGLDIRLIDFWSSELLSGMNYLGDYIFAFDNWGERNIIQSKLNLLKWRKPWGFKFFVYIDSGMKLSDTINRIVWLIDRKCLPYIMRHISCYNSTYNSFFTDLAAYCNQPNIIKKMNFYNFLERRHINKGRIYESFKLWVENGGN